MKTVGVRDLKNRLSAYLRDVRAGRTVAITDRGRVVAELTPPRNNGRQNAFTAMVRRGAIVLRKNDPRAYPPRRKRLLAPGVLQRLLDAERADR